MTTKKPTSYKVFITVISITAIVFLIAVLFAHYQVDKKYTMVLALLMFIALAFTTVGIYSAFKFTSDETKLKLLNRIGLIGNFMIFAFTIALMAYAALTKADS